LYINPGKKEKMMTKQEIKEIAPPDDAALKEIEKCLNSAKKDTKQYTIEIVTPMFGGGAKAGIVDEKMPIRVTEIRGHLRFWWRLLYGKNYSSLE
jgi:hypothetical protein